VSVTTKTKRRPRNGQNVISVGLPREKLEFVRELARGEGITVSDIVRAGIDAELDRRRVQAVSDDEMTLLGNAGGEDPAVVLDDDNNKETRGVA